MKRIFSFLTAVSILLLSSGCTPSNETDPPTAETTSNTAETTSSAPETTSSAPETTSKAAETTAKAPETTKTEEITDDIEYEIFKGFPKAENTINTVNCKEYRPSLLCYGGGSTFFMWDGTVYEHNKSTTEPLFEKYAYNLNYNNGKLYFVEDDEFDLYSMDSQLIEGFVYRYDLETGDMEQITDYPVSQLTVTDEGIFYTHYAMVDNPEPATGIYRIDEATGQSERLYDSFSCIEYGGYKLKYIKEEDGRIATVFSNDEEEYFLNYDHNMWECISGDYYYYRKVGGAEDFLNRVSMLTGERIWVKPYESVSDYRTPNQKPVAMCIDFTVLNDTIYFIDDTSSLRRYDEDIDFSTPIKCGEYLFKYIFADDESIYGIGRDILASESAFHFVKLTVNGDKAEAEVLA